MPTTFFESGPIKKLSAETSNHIQSAYEISSPLCIVQELVRNSVEGLASKITISLSANGLEIIQVADDGVGINSDSLSLLAQRGCTSKSPDNGRGSALAAIVTVSTQVKICTRSPNNDVGTQVVFDDPNEAPDIKSVASNMGTSVTVTQPLSKLPVRYNLVRTQSARIKRDIREWIVAFCLANHNVSVSLVTLGQTQKTAGSILFTRTPSLLDAVTHFLGNSYKDYVVEIDNRDTQNNEVLPAASARTRMDEIAYEGVFAIPQCLEPIESTKLPRLSVSVNGVACKADVFPGLARYLYQQHRIVKQDDAPGSSNTTSKRFLGVVNVVVPAEMFDVSSRLPWFVNEYDSECIEAVIIDRFTAVLGDKTAALASPQQATQKALSLLDWSRGKCGIDEPTSIHLPVANNSKRKPTESSAGHIGMKRTRSRKAPKATLAQVTKNAVTAVNKDTVNISVPQARWSTHSDRLYGALANGSVGNVICVLCSDGSAATPEAINSRKPSERAKPVAYLIANDLYDIVALDIRSQQDLESGVPRSVELGPELRPYAAIARISDVGL